MENNSNKDYLLLQQKRERRRRKKRREGRQRTQQQQRLQENYNNDDATFAAANDNIVTSATVAEALVVLKEDTTVDVNNDCDNDVILDAAVVPERLTPPTTTATNTKRRNVYILPGNEILQNNTNVTPPPLPLPPPPPMEAPPKPTKLCRILILGDEHVGKSSLVNLFVHRTCCSPSSPYEKDNLNLKKEKNEFSTETKKLQQQKQEMDIINMEYHKKDVTLLHNDEVTCVRVQIWDITTTTATSSPSNLSKQQHQKSDNDLFYDAVQEENDKEERYDSKEHSNDNNINSTTNCYNDYNTKKNKTTTTTEQKFDQLFEKANGILLVCTLHPPGYQIESMTTNDMFQYVKYTIAKWMKFIKDAHERKVHKRETRFKQQHHGKNNDRTKDEEGGVPIPVTILFNKSDPLLQHQHNIKSSPLDYVQMGINLQSLCDQWNITDHYFGSCCGLPALSSSSTITPVSFILSCLIKHHKRQCQEIMSCNDAFTSLIQYFLDKEANNKKLEKKKGDEMQVESSSSNISCSTMASYRIEVVKSPPPDDDAKSTTAAIAAATTESSLPKIVSSSSSMTPPIVEAHAITIQDDLEY